MMRPSVPKYEPSRENYLPLKMQKFWREGVLCELVGISLRFANHVALVTLTSQVLGRQGPAYA